MSPEFLDALTRDWPGVTSDVKWEADLCYSVAGKMFVVHCFKGKEAGRTSFKVDEQRFLELTDQPGIIPAPYLARAHWVCVVDPAAHPEDMLKSLIRRSYELVRARLTKKLQRELAD